MCVCVCVCVFVCVCARARACTRLFVFLSRSDPDTRTIKFTTFTPLGLKVTHQVSIIKFWGLSACIADKLREFKVAALNHNVRVGQFNTYSLFR